ncbi:flavin reductase family protein [Streptomyces sp. NPDC048566]|uniref:flavin reductase family protein n=1 Tax=Streptomyces sp. NPDC048566 TaxID=3365569 RepID=UPI00371F1CE9
MTVPSTTSRGAVSPDPGTPDPGAHWPAGSRTATARAATRRFATGVTVLTCGRDEGTHGVTVSTLTLASMKPPMVSVALRRDSRGLAALLASGAFAVNVLAGRQDPLARHFARSDRGEGLGRPGRGVWAGHTADGVPLLGGAVGWLRCRVTRTVPAGDHELVLALVADARLGTTTEPPLVNFAGDLHRFPPAAPPDDTIRSRP